MWNNVASCAARFGSESVDDGVLKADSKDQIIEAPAGRDCAQFGRVCTTWVPGAPPGSLELYILVRHW